MKTNLSCFYAHVHVLLIESNGVIYCKRKCLFPGEVDLVTIIICMGVNLWFIWSIVKFAIIITE